MVIKNNRYFDANGDEIHEGDKVFLDGREWKVFRTVDGELGVDATNPAWVKSGRAIEGEFGIYPFEEIENPVLVRS